MKNKDLPKIAIKYSEENWPEIKKAVDLLRSKGFSVERRKYVDSIDEREFIGNFNDDPSLSNQRFNYFYSLGGEDKEYQILTMPDDFEKLKSYFEEEPKLEVRKWYQHIAHQSINMLCVNGKMIGFDGVGSWVEWEETSNTELWKPANMNKVKELLIREAEKRGFKHGVKYKFDKYSISSREITGGINISEDTGNVIDEMTNILFDCNTGKWAEIIEEKEQHKTPHEEIEYRLVGTYTDKVRIRELEQGLEVSNKIVNEQADEIAKLLIENKNYKEKLNHYNCVFDDLPKLRAYAKLHQTLNDIINQ